MRNFAREIFLPSVGIWGVFLTIQTFFKAKNNILKTSIKLKISVTCVYREYKVKIKMVQEQWLQLKMKFLFGYIVKIVI